MLLSMYASYHWAGKKNCVRNLGLVILLMLFSCAFLPLGITIMLSFPVTLLSFPFYSYVSRIYFEGHGWVDFVRIRLLSIDLTAHLPADSPRSHLLSTLSAFPLFLCVNVIGAVLGYRASRTCRIREWGNSRTWSLIGFVFGFALVGVGYWLSVPLVESGEVIYGFGRGPHGIEGVATFFFGIIVLAIVIGKILWPIWIQERP